MGLSLAIGLVLMAPAPVQAASLRPADVGAGAIAAMLGGVVIVVFLVGLPIRSGLAAQRTRLAAELDHTKLILDTAEELGRLLASPAICRPYEASARFSDWSLTPKAL